MEIASIFWNTVYFWKAWSSLKSTESVNFTFNQGIMCGRNTFGGNGIFGKYNGWNISSEPKTNCVHKQSIHHKALPRYYLLILWLNNWVLYCVLHYASFDQNKFVFKQTNATYRDNWQWRQLSHWTTPHIHLIKNTSNSQANLHSAATLLNVTHNKANQNVENQHLAKAEY